MANEYLRRKPTGSGNRRRWTVAFWMKNSDPTQGYTAIMGAGKLSPNNIYNELWYNGSKIGLNLDDASNTLDNYTVTANPILRDPNSWRHVVVSFTDHGDTTRTRAKFYINGALVDNDNDTSLETDELSFLNHVEYIHYIGSRVQQSAGTTTFDAQYFDIYMVDGQTLSPDVFGFNRTGTGYYSVASQWESPGTKAYSTDFRPGQWSPHLPKRIITEVERSGGFGANGFYLPMNDSSNPGADFHCTPNTIIKLKGEDSQQPRSGTPTTSDAFVSELREEKGTLGFDGCIKCDGNDGLDVAANAALDLGTGDFTIEAFYWLKDEGSYHSLFDMRGTGGDGLYMSLFRHNSENKLYLYANSAVRIDNIPRKNNQWMHVAICRSSGVTRAFVDGELAGAFNDNLDYICRNLLIGQSNANSNDLYGFISNFRIVKGTALYTSNFTRPTSPLENVSNTILLCANSSTSATASTVTPSTITAIGDVFATKNELTGSIILAAPFIAGGQGDYSADIRGSGTNKTVNVNGTFSINDCPSYYGSALICSPGVDGYAEVVADAEFADLADGDHTIEFWYKQDTWDDSYLPHHSIIGLRHSNSNVAWRFAFTDKNTSEDGIQLFGTNGFSTTDQTLNNDWNHCAIEQCKYSDGIRTTVYLNGAAAGETAGSVGYPTYQGSTGPIVIGTDPRSASLGDTYSFDGKIQDVRIYKGVAKYKGSFDVVKPYTPIGIETFRTTSDTPRNNFATLNPLATGPAGGVAGQTVANLTAGNLYHGLSNQSMAPANMGVTSGKWYAEFMCHGGSGGFSSNIGVAGPDKSGKNYETASYGGSGSEGMSYIRMSDSGGITKNYNATATNTITLPYDPGDIIGVTIDADTKEFKYYRNGTLFFTDTGAQNYNNKTFFFTSWRTNDGVSGADWSNVIANFGQGQTFHNIKAVDRNRINSTNSSWTLTFSGASGNFTVSDDGRTLSGTPGTSSYMRADVTLDPKKKYLLSLTYTAGAANDLAVQDDKGYTTTTNGVATSALQVGERYSVVISASVKAQITATSWNTAYTVEDIVISEIDEGYPDANGIGKFAFDPPTGFLALCTDNLPAPAIPDPGKHFKAVLYRGDDSKGRKIDVGFKPDLVWIKARNASVSHCVMDSMRAYDMHYTNSSGSGNSTGTLYLSGYGNNGFDLDDGANSGGNTAWRDYVAWCWKAGGVAVTNKDGDDVSLVSANTEAGFSIVKTTSAGTVGHGLNSTPQFMITKRDMATSSWSVQHHEMMTAATGKILMESNAGIAASSTPYMFNANATTFECVYGADASIHYCWHEVEGYSRFGSYLGNADSNGPFCWCGFRPAFVLIKNTSSGEWCIWDSSRSPYNEMQDALRPNTSATETDGFQLDFVSNGFKVRDTEGSLSGSDQLIFFAAFAESPFKTANAR